MPKFVELWVYLSASTRLCAWRAAHGIGTARALQVNADAGADAGLALVLQVLLASLLIPLVFRLF